MACKVIEIDNSQVDASEVKAASDCKCYMAVMRTYESLLDAGRPNCVALDAARIVYGYHHPEDTKQLQHLTVERWVNERHLH